jgi:cytochrome c6
VRSRRLSAALAAGALLALGACGEEERLQPEEPAGGGGRSVFVDAGCGSCHTLAAVGASGTSGPNLDEVRPSVREVQQVVANGRGAMPPFRGRLSQEEIRALAEYVVSEAGTRP